MSEHTENVKIETSTPQTAAPAAGAAPAKPKRPKPKSMIMLGEQTAALFDNARLAKERGEKVGWSASIFPQEIAETLGLNVLYPENHSAGIAARHQADPFLQECEGPLGYSNDLCAYAKVNLAYASVLNGESDVELPDGGKMVKPDFLLLTNNICNQLTKWYENLARQMNIPIFFIDTCYNPWDYVTETRVRYVRAQIDQLIKDLCEFTGKTWDDERFKEVMKISQRNSYLWERANNLLDRKPSPLSGFELFNYMSAMVCNRGKTSSTAILEQLNSEIEKHIEEGTSTFPVEEQFRISWDGIACWPYLSHNLRTLKKYGINMVASSYGKAWAIEYEDLEEKPGMFTDIEKLTKKDMEEEFFYVGLRMTAGVSLSEFERRFGISAKEVYPGLMETFVKEKAARFEGDRFVLTDYGLDVSNYIMAQFLQD